MPRRCPFHPKRWCGKSVTACLNCEYRRKAGQKLLVKELPPEEETPTATVDILQREFTCPYCLYTGTLSKFTIRLKSGKPSEKRFKCPDCGEVMRRNTIIREQTVEEFAEWVFDTTAWKRVSFSKFKQRLKDMGISYQFWNHYKKFKQEMLGSTESYEDHMMRQQREEHEESIKEYQYALAILSALEEETGIVLKDTFAYRLSYSHLHISADAAEELIDKMLREGVIFEPKTGYVKRV